MYKKLILEIGAQTDPGPHLELCPNRSHLVLQTPLGCVALVIETLGDLEKAGVATTLTRDIVLQNLAEEVYHSEDINRTLLAGLEEANAILWEAAQSSQPTTGELATMCSGVTVGANGFRVFHVGRCGVFHVREGHTIKLTKEQAMVEDLTQTSAFKNPQGADSPKRTVTTNALGFGQDVTVETGQDVSFYPGDSLIILSQALSSNHSKTDLAEAVANGSSAGQACKGILKMARQAGDDTPMVVVVIKATE